MFSRSFRFRLAATLCFASFFRASVAFVPNSGMFCGSRNVVRLYMSDGGSNSPPKKKLTAADIINRARQAVGMPPEEEAPKIFEDNLLDDMRQSLQMLEKRVTEGAGSLTTDEVQEFEARMKRVVVEMREKQHRGGSVGGTSGPSRNINGANQSPAFASPPSSASPSVEVAKSTGYGITDKSNDEGPAYDGTGGMGVARGTRNTYVIPGMDEMTPEEYRKALQKSVSDRQSRRKGSRGGVVGNRAALQYLDQLGWGGASSNWKSGKDQEEK